jgi:hypothetical protein
VEKMAHKRKYFLIEFCKKKKKKNWDLQCEFGLIFTRYNFSFTGRIKTNNVVIWLVGMAAKKSRKNKLFDLV